MKTFKYETNLDTVNKGFSLVQQNGGTINELSTGYTFSISGVEGTIDYNQNNNVLTIKVSDKPFLASWSMIEDKLDDFFR